MNELCRKIRDQLDELPVADVHSHLGGVRQAQSLADIASYHWLSKELARAKGGPLEADPGQDPEAYLHEVVPLFPAVRNTVNHWAFMGILRDLYGFQARTLTEGNWREADQAVRAHADDPQWLPGVLDQAGIQRLFVAIRDGMPDATERYVPYEYGEPLYAIRSLAPFEQWAGSVPDSPAALRGAISERVDWLASEKGVRALHVWPPGPWTYQPVDDDSADTLLRRLASGVRLSHGEADAVASFSADATAQAAASHGMVVQLFHGSIRYTPQGYNAAYWNPDFLRSLAPHFEKHPHTRFDLFLATRLPSQEAVFLSRSYPNLVVSGAWWHGFSPSTLHTFFRDRLELLPNTAWNAFYSDGYIVEWCYGKLLVTRHCLARALAQLVEEGFLIEDDVVDIARKVLWENPLAAYGLAEGAAAATE
ncbi:MAG: hypothetical protein ACLF0G_00625 [Candidatus Brocadiia bacterium]